MTKRNRFFQKLSGVALVLAMVMMLTVGAVAVLADEAVYDHFVAYKYGDVVALGPGDEMTFTILMYNSSINDMIVDVVDPLPAELTYVAGTASNGGVYDPVTRELSWSGVTVPFAGQVKLTFDVMAPATIAAPTDVTNVATVTTESNTYNPEAMVSLLPVIPPGDDVTPPVVVDFVIADADALTTQDVILHITATDDVAVTQMLIKEWQVIEKPQPRWDEVKSSDWIPFDADYEWTLGDAPGVHFIAVWVADAAWNISPTAQENFDFASYLAPETTIANKIGMVPYMMYYDAGVNVGAVLTAIAGDPDMFALSVQEGGLQMITSAVGDEDVLSFTTAEAGLYVILVSYSSPDPASPVTYNLAVRPGGGPSAWQMAPNFGIGDEMQSIGADYYSNFINELHLNPISIAQPPLGLVVGPYKLFMPTLIK